MPGRTRLSATPSCRVSLDVDRRYNDVPAVLAFRDGEKLTLMVASIRYLDQFVKQDGSWLFAERKLMVDWTDTRGSMP